MTFADREPLRHRYPNGPYSMLGPVEVIGAEPGDTIECTLVPPRHPRIGAGTRFPLGVGALPADFAQPYVHYFRFHAARTISTRPAPRPSTWTGSRSPWRRSWVSWRSSRPGRTR